MSTPEKISLRNQSDITLAEIEEACQAALWASTLATVDAGLDASNALFPGLADVRPVVCSAHGPDGTVIGGAVGRRWGLGAELQQLWVAPAYRGRGIALGLLQSFEAAALRHGCRQLYLETFSFQAPGLYAKAGWRTAHTLSGFAPGVQKFLMVKDLAAPEDVGS